MLEFTKYLIYASFILNIACGVWEGLWEIFSGKEPAV